MVNEISTYLRLNVRVWAQNNLLNLYLCVVNSQRLFVALKLSAIKSILYHYINSIHFKVTRGFSWDLVPMSRGNSDSGVHFRVPATPLVPPAPPLMPPESRSFLRPWSFLLLFLLPVSTLLLFSFLPFKGAYWISSNSSFILYCSPFSYCSFNFAIAKLSLLLALKSDSEE